jgi:hypothetical protein
MKKRATFRWLITFLDWADYKLALRRYKKEQRVTNVCNCSVHCSHVISILPKLEV